MAAFNHRSLDAAGREVAGSIDADSLRAARGLLRDRGLFPLQVADARPAPGRRRLLPHRVREADLCLLTRQWSTLLVSGLTMEQALTALIEQAEAPAVAQVLDGVRAEILGGYALRAALDRYPEVFPTIYRASVAAGEKSGELATVMDQLAEHLERRHALRQKTLQALLYPAIVSTVALLVVIGLMTYVVPQVVAVFQQGKQALPLLTRLLIMVSAVIRDWGWLLVLLAVAAVVAGRLALRREPLRRAWDAWLLRLPLLGQIGRAHV